MQSVAVGTIFSDEHAKDIITKEIVTQLTDTDFHIEELSS